MAAASSSAASAAAASANPREDELVNEFGLTEEEERIIQQIAEWPDAVDGLFRWGLHSTHSRREFLEPFSIDLCNKLCDNWQLGSWITYELKAEAVSKLDPDEDGDGPRTTVVAKILELIGPNDYKQFSNNELSDAPNNHAILEVRWFNRIMAHIELDQLQAIASWWHKRYYDTTRLETLTLYIKMRKHWDLQQAKAAAEYFRGQNHSDTWPSDLNNIIGSYTSEDVNDENPVDDPNSRASRNEFGLTAADERALESVVRSVELEGDKGSYANYAAINTHFKRLAPRLYKRLEGADGRRDYGDMSIWNQIVSYINLRLCPSDLSRVSSLSIFNELLHFGWWVSPHWSKRSLARFDIDLLESVADRYLGEFKQRPKGLDEYISERKRVIAQVASEVLEDDNRGWPVDISTIVGSYLSSDIHSQNPIYPRPRTYSPPPLAAAASATPRSPVAASHGPATPTEGAWTPDIPAFTSADGYEYPEYGPTSPSYPAADMDDEEAEYYLAKGDRERLASTHLNTTDDYPDSDHFSFDDFWESDPTSKELRYVKDAVTLYAPFNNTAVFNRTDVYKELRQNIFKAPLQYLRNLRQFMRNTLHYGSIWDSEDNDWYLLPYSRTGAREGRQGRPALQLVEKALGRYIEEEERKEAVLNHRDYYVSGLYEHAVDRAGSDIADLIQAFVTSDIRTIPLRRVATAVVPPIQELEDLIMAHESLLAPSASASASASAAAASSDPNAMDRETLLRNYTALVNSLKRVAGQMQPGQEQDPSKEGNAKRQRK